MRRTKDPTRGHPGALFVVIVSHTAQLSGGELALLRLVRHLSPSARMHVVLGERGPLLSRLVEAGATVEILPLVERSKDLRRGRLTLRQFPVSAAFDAIRYSFRLSRRLKELQPDLVHTNTLKSALYGGVAARLARLPCLWHIRDRISPDYIPAPAVRMIRGLAKVLPTAVVTDTATVLETLRLGRGKGDIVPSLIEHTSRTRLDREESPFCVAMVGRIARWKGQDIFLRAFATAFPNGGELAAVVGSPLFGEQDFETELRGLVDELGLDDRVTFRGFQQDVESELRSADVLVHASVLAEPYGQVILEAMAAGTPVIASDAGGPAEIVTDGLDGLLTPVSDVDALARALRELAGSPLLREKLREGGYQTVQKYSPEVIVPKMMMLYESVAARRVQHK